MIVVSGYEIAALNVISLKYQRHTVWHDIMGLLANHFWGFKQRSFRASLMSFLNQAKSAKCSKAVIRPRERRGEKETERT